MAILIRIEKRHLYGFAVLVALFLGGLAVYAFGGNNPAVLGHSAGELIVNSTSIVDGSIVNADVNAAAAIDGSKINAASLSGTAAGLNIGGSSATAGNANQAAFLTSAPGCGGGNFVQPDQGSCILHISSNNPIHIDGYAFGSPASGVTRGAVCIDTNNQIWVNNSPGATCH